MRAKYLTVLILVLIGVSGAGVFAQQSAGPLSIISAQRAKSYQTRTGELKPRDEDADVVIVVRVGGLSRDEFRRIRQDSISLKSGDEQLPPSLVLSGVIDGKDELKAVFVGPKNTLEMQLVLGEYAVAVKAEEAIADQLR